MKKKSVRIFLILYILVCLAGIGIIFATKENSLEVENRDVNNPVLETKYEACLEIKDVEEEDISSLEKNPEKSSTSAKSVLNRSAFNAEPTVMNTDLRTGAIPRNIKNKKWAIRKRTSKNILITNALLNSERTFSNTEYAAYASLNTKVLPEAEVKVVGVEDITLTGITPENTLSTEIKASDIERNRQIEDHSGLVKEPILNTKNRLVKLEDISSDVAYNVMPEISIEKKSSIVNSLAKEYSLSEEIMDIGQESKNEEIKETLDIENITEQSGITNNPQELSPVSIFNSPEKEELLEILECIAKRNPNLAIQLRKYNDPHNINALLINRNKVVLKNYKASSITVPEKKTLWEVLQACKKESNTNIIDPNSSKSTKWIILSYPLNLMYNPFVVHAMLTYYNPNDMSSVFLSLLQFDFQYNKNIFNEFQIFKKILGLKIFSAVFYACTLNTLEDFTNLKELQILKGTILVSDDTEMVLSLPMNLKTLTLRGIDKKYINWILSGLSSCQNIQEIDISEIDFMDTYALNKLTNLEQITEFRLGDIVLIGYLDFSFLKRMSALKTLSMLNIFYSYSEKFKVDDLNKIKQNTTYLMPESEKRKIPVEYLDIVKENTEVGSYISPITITIDSKLYNDLGLHKIEPREGKVYTMQLEFVNSIDYFLVDLVEIKLSLNKTHQRLDLNIKSDAKLDPKSLLLENIQSIDLPFLQSGTIETINLKNYLNNKPKENAIMDILSDKIMKYAKNNKIKNLKLISLAPSVTIDMYKIVLFNRNMPNLENLKLSNITFAPDSTEPENMDEKNTLQSYKEYIKNSPSHKFFTFIKEQNALEISGSS
ncbi:hypothetical protein NEIRO03_1553 [Nematocida sp. AWRm78]|nr:hypothetical protein NEIRO02_1577 [Nematocida sp. AWRm79]KAI5184087.1 hypothetical protein NEIRO03_1553 [Nematocida sp. AWRm78]